MKKFSAFVKSARFAEVSILLGFPLIGLFFAFESPSQLLSRPVALFVLAVFFLFTAIYAFNGLAGIGEDAENDRLSDLKNRKSTFVATLAVSLSLSLVLFFMIKSALAFFAVVSFLLWCVYSFPKKGFKYRPVLGTLIHFFGQIIHFLMGYAVIKPVDTAGIAASVYFALLFSAGHINHELIDREADEKTGIMTGAVYFGAKKWEIVSFSLFFAAALYIFAASMAVSGMIVYTYPFVAAGLIHTVYKLISFRKPPKQAKFLAERSFYRILYFVAGILFIEGKIFTDYFFTR